MLRFNYITRTVVQDADMASHDRRFHPNGFDPRRDHCTLREEMAKTDKADMLSPNEGRQSTGAWDDASRRDAEAAGKVLRNILGGVYVTFSNGPYEGKNGDSRKAILGEKGAEKLGIGKLDDAKKMERDGASREDIWRKTGWWKGKDGKWRVEVPDLIVKDGMGYHAQLAKISDARSLAHIAYENEAQEWEAAEDAYKAFQRHHPVKGRTDDEREKARALAKERTRLFKAQGVARTKMYEADSALDQARRFGTPAVSLADMVDAPELFKAYPELKKTSVRLTTRLPKGTLGNYDDEHDLIEISAEISDKDLLDTLVHEVQHTIQEREGFAKGGNVSQFNAVDVQEMRRKANRARLNGNEAEAARLESEADELEENGLDGMVVEERQGYMDPFEAYRSLTGETESRNVQKRLGMSAEERTATPPWETEDVEEDRQIVRFSNSAGKVIGEYDRATGKITLYPGAKVKDVVHEYAHGLWQFAEQEAKAGKGGLLSKMKEIGNSAPQAVKDAVRANYGSEGADVMLEECFAHELARRSDTAFAKAIETAEGKPWYRRAWGAIKDVWKGFATRHGMNNADIGGIDSMPPSEAAERILSQMAKGKRFGSVSAPKAKEPRQEAKKPWWSIFGRGRRE